MKRKIVGIFVMTLLIATAVLPAVGTMNEVKDRGTLSLDDPMVEWSKTFGGDEFDLFYDVKHTDDGGFIACGVTEDSDNYYAWLMKLDSNGNEEWSVINHDINGTLVTGANMDINCNFVQETSDEGYIICGYSMVFLEYEGESGWVNTGHAWKIDDAGSTEWIQRFYSFEESSIDLAWCIKEIDDGYILSGWKIFYNPEDFSVTDMDGYLTKIDFNGNLVWQKTYDIGGQDHLCSVCTTNDGGYLLTGDTTENENYPLGALWMVKTDNDGNKQWEKIFDGPEFEYSYARYAYQTSDGGYIMVGVTQSYGNGRNDVWIIKTDSSGNIDWDKTFGGTGHDNCWSMDKTSDGGYVFVARKAKFGGSKDDSWVLKTDEDGNTEWSFIIEEDDDQSPHTIRSTTDGGVILSGHSGGQMGSPNADGLLVKVAPFENQRPNKPTCKYDRANDKLVVSATDPDGDQVRYGVDWENDGVVDQWTELFDSGVEASIDCEDKEGTVEVTAEDEHGGQSDCISVKSISKPYINAPFLRFLEQYQHMFPLLRQLLGLT